MKVLVLGADGQLGRHLRQFISNAEFWTRKELDLTDVDAISPRISALSPKVIINCAAFTDVAAAEQQSSAAWLINCTIPKRLASIATKLGSFLIHISTDYVFDGTSNQPYRKDQIPAPLNEYGRSKLAGELAIANESDQYLILRTSWLFSEYGKNFAKSMLKLQHQNTAIRVVGDQIGTPTYAGHLASTLISLAAQSNSEHLPKSGVYHLSGGRPTSWHGFTVRLFELALAMGIIENMPVVENISTEEFPTKVIRPRYSALQSSAEILACTQLTPDWESGISQMLCNLSQANISATN